MYKVEDFVIAIYCLIEDELYSAFCQQHGLPRRAGFPPALSDSECLTVELVGQYLGYTSQKQLYEQMHDRWSTWFPALKDRVAFTRQCANLWQVKAWMHHHLVDRLGGDQAPAKSLIPYPYPSAMRRVGFNAGFSVPSRSVPARCRPWAIVRPKTKSTLALRAGCASPTMA